MREEAIQKIRGPYTLAELADLTGVSARTLRRYQKQGIIPRERCWGNGQPSPLFYKIDVERVLAERERQKSRRWKAPIAAG